MIFAFVVFSTSFEVSAQSAEIEAVRKPLESYLMGHKTGEAKYMKMAMHTEGKLMYIRDGKYTTVDFPDYIARMKPRTFTDENQRKRYIESIEVSGNIAVAKLILDYPTIHFTDYMTLLKTGKEWRIINKIAFSVRDPKNNKAEPVNLADVRVPLENYLMNDKTDDPEYAKKAFHNEGKLIWMSRGKYTTLDFKDFIAGMDGKVGGNEAEKGRWIESISVTGNIAVAKVVLDNPRARVYDFFSLMNIDGSWKIVNKSYRVERKQMAK